SQTEQFTRGVVGMARSQDPNSANSQFFIMFAPAPNLDGQYTIVGKVESGMDLVDKIKKGDEADNGTVTDPDRMIKVRIAADGK
ncbi:MAG: peptidylprolyl isomerase, partial [Mesorhizobium sp.]